MKLMKVRSIKELGHWMQKRGISTSEHPAFGGVTQGAHGNNSLHFRGLALDVNDRDVRDTKLGPIKIVSEQQALRLLFRRIKRVARKKGWPLNEMFFDKWGFIKEKGFEQNHPEDNHEGHLHVGFDKDSW